MCKPFILKKTISHGEKESYDASAAKFCLLGFSFVVDFHLPLSFSLFPWQTSQETSTTLHVVKIENSCPP
jgi:hypothetical protein